MESSKQMEIGQQKEDEPIEVSYALLRACSQRPASDVLQKVVVAINVLLNFRNWPGSSIRFPNDFDNVAYR